QPDITLYLDLPPEEGLERVSLRNSDVADDIETESRFEDKGLGFHTRVRDGYLTLSRTFPDRFHLIDGQQNKGAITQDIIDIIARKCEQFDDR
ncbi:MAG: dTMP kinase, partial [Candidatus Puniceispirillaceae bacterium]